MRRLLSICVLIFATGLAFGQDEPPPDQLKKMYDGALVQLKQAQDRKNELAAENDRLNARINDLQKQLDAARATLDDAARQSADVAEKTFFLRSHYAAWEDFIHRNPKLEIQWRVYMEGGSLSLHTLTSLIDTDWPFSMATTNPATNPTSPTTKPK